MERKLELKDICGYLPYGLKRIYLEEIFFGTITKYDNVSFNGNKTIYRNYKPILRPITDLYHQITHNGKELVPICEMAKMVCDFNWVIGTDEFGNKCAVYREYGSKDTFGFKIGSFYKSDYSQNIVPYQYQLFDYLHELKVDYRGLIDSGLAVSVYDFPENPYK